MDEEKSCFFCERPISDEETVSITENGFESIIETAKDYSNAKSEKIFEMKKNNTWFKMLFHNSCRATYISKKSRNSSRNSLKRLSNEESFASASLPKVKKNNDRSFDWAKDCFICSKGPNKTTNNLTEVSKNPEEIRENVLISLKNIGDLDKYNSLDSQVNLSTIKARYHKSCYALCLSENSNTSDKSSESINNIFKKTANEVWDEKKNFLIDGNFIYSVDLYNIFKKKLLEFGFLESYVNSLKNYRIKSVLVETSNNEFIFYTKTGKPDIICSVKIEMYDLLSKIMNQNIIV